MTRWQNCLAFETSESFYAHAKTNDGKNYSFSTFSIGPPPSFPAFYYLETDSYEPYWKITTKNFVVKRFEDGIKGYVEMLEDLQKNY